MFRRLLPLVLLVSGCEAPAVPETPRAPELVGFAMATKEKTYADCIAGVQGCTYVRFDYPVVTEAPAGMAVEAITETIRSFLSRPRRDDQEPQTASQFMEAFLDDFRAFREREPRSEQSWFLERKAFVLNNRRNVVSLSLGENSYLGGADRMATFRLINIDPATGATIQLEDVLREGALPELTARAETKLRQARNVEEGASLESLGFRFPSGQFELTSNFAIGADGLMFYYNPLDIGPYALGPTEIVLDYEEIGELLVPEFSLQPAS